MHFREHSDDGAIHTAQITKKELNQKWHWKLTMIYEHAQREYTQYFTFSALIKGENLGNGFGYGKMC